MIEQTPVEHEQNKKSWRYVVSKEYRPALIVGVSIVVGAIIIAGSVYFGFSKLQGKTVYNATTKTSGSELGTATGQQAQGTPNPIEVTSRDNQPVLGKNSAKITIYEFSDFQCPFCKQFVDQTSEQLKKQYIDTGKVKFVYRHLPLSFHANAEIAAIGAECANEQGKFWPYHDTLFTKGDSEGVGLDVDSLKKYADSLGLNSGTFGFGKNKFNTCLDAKSTSQVVKDDAAVAAQYGISGTPSFIIVKDGDKTIDLNAVSQAVQARQNVITFSNGNAMLVGAQPLNIFQNQLDRMLAE